MQTTKEIPSPAAKAKQSADINAQIEAFFAKGGKITYVESHQCSNDFKASFDSPARFDN